MPDLYIILALMTRLDLVFCSLNMKEYVFAACLIVYYISSLDLIFRSFFTIFRVNIMLISCLWLTVASLPQVGNNVEAEIYCPAFSLD